MFEYFKYLISQVNSFDDKLKSHAFFRNKTWVRVSQNGINEKWFFRNKGELNISRNGNILDGKYEFLGDYLIFEFLNHKILLNKSLLYKDILILEKDSNNSELFVFYDNSKFSNATFIRHLEDSRKKDLNIKQIYLFDKTRAEVIRKRNQHGVNLGNSILINGNLTDLESIETDYNFYYLKNGKIIDISYKRKYNIGDNHIVIKQKWKKLRKDDFMISYDKRIQNGIYKIKDRLGVFIENNIVKKVYRISYRKTIIKQRELEIWSYTSGQLLKGSMVMKDNQLIDNGVYWIDLFKFIKVKNGKIV